jgi:argininosuccinate synthase
VIEAIGHGDPIDHQSLTRMAHPIIAAALVEIAAIEGARTVAHAAASAALTGDVHAVDPALRVIAPALDWISRGVDVPAYLAMHRLFPGVARAERNLLMRRPLQGASTTARVTIGFEGGVPVSLNGVAMGLKDLIECVSVISGQYMAAAAVGAPALALLQTAYAACGGRDSATVELRPLTIGVVDEIAADEALVNRA